MDNQASWEKFARGDRLTLNELDLLISEIASAIPYLENRTSHVGHAVLADARMVLGRLRDYHRAQKKELERVSGHFQCTCERCEYARSS